jgi:hypothetical protein
MSNPLLSVVHASARPAGWRPCYTAWMAARTGEFPIEYILAVDRRQVDEFRVIPDGVRVVVNDGRECCVDAYNAGAGGATGDVLMLQSDDMFPPVGWDEMLAAVLPEDPRDKDFVVHCATWPTWAPDRIDLQILSRGRYRRLGYALYPEFMSMSADEEFTQHARHDGVIIDARHIKVEHRHPQLNPSVPWDSCYELEMLPERFELGDRILARRVAEGFPASLRLDQD